VYDADFSGHTAVDTEFESPPSGLPVPTALVACDLYTGKTIKLWRDDLLKLKHPPFPAGPDAVVYAHNASAELGVFDVLGWTYRGHIHDTLYEHLYLTNGLREDHESCSLDAVAEHHGIPALDKEQKKYFQKLCAEGRAEPYRTEVLDYCETDVRECALIAGCQKEQLNGSPYTHLRGATAKAQSRMFSAGIPVDVGFLRLLYENRQLIINTLRDEYDHWGFFKDGHLSYQRLEDYQRTYQVPWERTDVSHRLKIDNETLKKLGSVYPEIEALRFILNLTDQLKGTPIVAGPDDRHRFASLDFKASTGRAIYLAHECILLRPHWMRGLIRPQPGNAIIHLDYKSQEFVLAAIYSGDPAMHRCVAATDAYIEFGRLIGLTESQACAQRKTLKTICLGVQYGMGPGLYADKYGVSVREAHRRLGLHRKAFPVFYEWRECVELVARSQGYIDSAAGWRLRLGFPTKTTALYNFPLQAGGADIMRFVSILLTEAGIKLLASLHDGFYIECRADEAESVKTRAQWILAEAAHAYCGYPLKSDAHIFLDRYHDDDCGDVLARIHELLRQVSGRSV
jgi:hypothetical protein